MTDMQARYRRLNELLYSADPGDYFYVRLLSVLVMAGRSNDVLRLLADGATYAGVYVVVEDAEVHEEGVRDFVSIESQVLLHHAAEAVVRMFLAHAGHPPCPWLEVAGENDFRRFKARVEAEVLKVPAHHLHDAIAYVFLGGQANGIPGLTDEQWVAARDNLTTFLRVLAERWLTEAQGYNAVKHGLSVQPSAAVARFADESGGSFDIGNGPSLAFLDPTPWDKQTGTRAWQITTQWLDVGQSLNLIYVASKMLDTLWMLARARYLGTTPSGEAFVPYDLTPDKLRTPANNRARLTMPTGIRETRPQPSNRQHTHPLRGAHQS